MSKSSQVGNEEREDIPGGSKEICKGMKLQKVWTCLEEGDKFSVGTSGVWDGGDETGKGSSDQSIGSSERNC